MKTQWKLVTAGVLVSTLIACARAQAQTEYVASEQWTVGPGDYILSDGVPGCGNNTMDWLNEAGKLVAATYTGGAYGALISVLQSTAQAVRPQTAGAIGAVLDAIYGGDRYANCVPVSVIIPATARIERFEFTASDQTGTRACRQVDVDCDIGWSRFDQPVMVRAGGATIITSTFRNWSADRTRDAKMSVYFID